MQHTKHTEKGSSSLRAFFLNHNLLLNQQNLPTKKRRTQICFCPFRIQKYCNTSTPTFLLFYSKFTAMNFFNFSLNSAFSEGLYAWLVAHLDNSVVHSSVRCCALPMGDSSLASYAGDTRPLLTNSSTPRQRSKSNQENLGGKCVSFPHPK